MAAHMASLSAWMRSAKDETRLPGASPTHEIELVPVLAVEHRVETRSGHDLDKIGGLLSEGLVSGPQKLALEQNILQAEANGLDVKLATLRAQQEISKIDRNIVDLRNQWRNDSLAEFNKTQATLADLAQRPAAAQSAAAAPAPAAAPAACGQAKDEPRSRHRLTDLQQWRPLIAL